MRKASHCGSKQQQRSHVAVTPLLLVHATYIWVLFFAYIPFIPGTHTTRITLSRRAQARRNCLSTGVGRFHSCLYKWGMASCAVCECGAEEQTVDHVVLQCPIHRPPHGLHGLMVLNDETIEWLLNICPGSSVAKQWFQQLVQTKEDPVRGESHIQ